MSAKIIHLKEAPQVVDVVKQLEQAVINDEVTEAVLIYRVKPTTDYELGRIMRYWFGENSTIMCLGLARHMCDVIANHIKEENEIIEE